MIIKIMKWDIVAYARRHKQPVFPTGVFSRVRGKSKKEERELLFLDYDNVNEEDVRSDIAFLQKMFKLGGCYLFQSSERSYHVICLEKYTYRKIVQLHEYLEAVDSHFKQGPRYNRFGSWVLRLTDKEGLTTESIKYIDYIYSNYGCREKSNAHRLWLNWHYKLDIPKTKEYDNCKQIDITTYITFKKG